MNPRSLAINGVGFDPIAMATSGQITFSEYEPLTDGVIPPYGYSNIKKKRDNAKEHRALVARDDHDLITFVIACIESGAIK